MISSQESEKEIIFCNQCQNKTVHLVHNKINKHKEIGHYTDFDDEYPTYLSTSYTLLECRGCEAITLRKEDRCSEWEEYEGPDPVYYPPRTYRRLPEWKNLLPEDLQELMEEVYRALWSDNRRLATMGTRTLIESFISRKVGERIFFKDYLDDLEKEGYIGEKEKPIISSAIDAGSAASHRNFKPEIENLHHVMEIVGHVLHSYVTEIASNELKSAVPPRRRAPKK
ncbi:MAG TPA: DUF4145 domain-containing protein [Coleofasciculaceae cyanobacterium]